MPSLRTFGSLAIASAVLLLPASSLVPRDAFAPGPGPGGRPSGRTNGRICSSGSEGSRASVPPGRRLPAMAASVGGIGGDVAGKKGATIGGGKTTTRSIAAGRKASTGTLSGPLFYAVPNEATDLPVPVPLLGPDPGSFVHPTTPPLTKGSKSEGGHNTNDGPLPPSSSNFIESALSSYIGPRLILALVACLYGTNFPLGSIMADNMPSPSSVTSARMVLAALSLSPFLPRIRHDLRLPAILAGCFTSMGYVTQSAALVDTDPATVSFLGAATVLVCPLLEWLVDGRSIHPRDVPQTWIAAVLCLAGVAVLELMDPAAAAMGPAMAGEGSGGLVSSSVGFGTGDALALLQAVGFGTGCFLSERMMRKSAEAGDPDQALPVTAVLVATTAFISMVWSLADGWLFQPGGTAYALPNLLFDPDLTTVAAAVVWTGLVSTSLNFYVEISALGRVPSAEASVILATEPLWAALFGAGMLNEQFGMNDYVGGTLVVLACLANTLSPDKIRGWFGHLGPREEGEGATANNGQ